MDTITPIQKLILLTIIRSGGTWQRGVFRLATELAIDYSHAHKCVRQLEQVGLVRVERVHGWRCVLTALCEDF